MAVGSHCQGVIADMADGKEHSDTVHSGLRWPTAYQDMLPVIKERWGIRGSVCLNRKISGGKSGALVYAADVNSDRSSGQTILKLDKAPDSEWQEENEADRHNRAVADAPEFAEKHLPRLIHSLHYGHEIAVLYSIAGGGLEYAEPWPSCPFDQQLEMARQISRGLLEEWNRDYTLSDGLHAPSELLGRWLNHRLDPTQGGRIHELLQQDGQLAPEEPSLTFEGHWYPNPLAFSLKREKLPEQLRLRAVTGHCHGDLHGLNVLVDRSPSSVPSYYLIDLADYQSAQFLFFDHAYFEISCLLASRESATPENWDAILAHLSRFRHHDEKPGLHADDLGLIRIVTALRQEVHDWINRHEGERRSYMESQYLLARVAAGLGFAHKNISKESRRMAFVYAASNLKDYMKLNRLDWPKHGPSFVFGKGGPGIQGPEPTDGTDALDSPYGAVVPTPAAPPLSASADHYPAVRNQEAKHGTLLGRFVAELRRRSVIKVAGVYIIVSWLCLQVASALETALHLPPWTDTLVAVLLALGLPIACIVAWAFELSPEGLKPTKPSEDRVADTSREKRVLDYILVAGVLAILALTLEREGFQRFADNPIPASVDDMPISIAVLPFRDLDGAGGNDGFSDGLTIEIMNTLARTGQFRIPGQSSSFSYKDQAIDLRTVGQDLGVEYILEGSVRRADDQLRIEAQLVQANDGFLIWSDVYAEEMEDVFSIQEKIANAIGNALKVPLGIEADTLETERTDNPEAYDLFLKGLALLKQRGADLTEAVNLLFQSVTIDPDFAAGWAALSLTYDVFPDYIGEIDNQAVLPAAYYRRAYDAAIKAEQLDPDLAIVLHATGNAYRRQRQWILAEDRYRQALAVEPQNHEVMEDYSELLSLAGHHAQAIAMAQEMRQLDPLNPLYELREAQAHWMLDQSVADVKALTDLFGKYPSFQPFIARPLAGYMFQTDQVAQLKELVEDCTSCDPAWRDPFMEMIDATQSLSPEAIFLIYKDEPFLGYLFLDAIEGPDLVLEAFEYYVRSPSHPLLVYLMPWSTIDAIGSKDEFKFLVEELGLADYWRERGWPDHCEPLEGRDFVCR